MHLSSASLRQPMGLLSLPEENILPFPQGPGRSCSLPQRTRQLPLPFRSKVQGRLLREHSPGTTPPYHPGLYLMKLSCNFICLCVFCFLPLPSLPTSPELTSCWNIKRHKSFLFVLNPRGLEQCLSCGRFSINIY